MSKYDVPPMLALAALRAARDCAPGDMVELRLDHDVRAEYSLPGLEPAAGRMALRRTMQFAALPGGGVKYLGQAVTVLSEEIVPGAELEPHQLECGHPQGCGDPCGWCAAEDGLRALRRRVSLLLVAAASGDAVLTQRRMEELR